MYETTILEWFNEGEWREIGRAGNPRSTADLREHARNLAEIGGRYRLVQPSIFEGAPAVVIHDYSAVTA